MRDQPVNWTRLPFRPGHRWRGIRCREVLSLLAVLVSVAACQTPPPQVQLDPAPVYEGSVTPITGRVVLKVKNIADPAPYDTISTMILATGNGVRRTREHVQGRITAFRNNQDLITEITIDRRNEQALSHPVVIDIRHDEFRRLASVQANLDSLGSQGEGASLLESFKRRVIPFRPGGYAMHEVVYAQSVAENYFQTEAKATCRLGGETMHRGHRSYFLTCSGDGFAEMAGGKVMFSLDGYQIIDAETALPVASKLRVIGNGPSVNFSGVESMTVSLKEAAASARIAAPSSSGDARQARSEKVRQQRTKK